MLIPDHNVVVQNNRVVGLNETHAAHICSEIIDFVDALAHLHAGVQIAQIYLMVLIAYFVVVEVVSVLPVRNTNEVTFSLEALGDVAANEATTTSDENTEFSCHLLEMNCTINQLRSVFGFGNCAAEWAGPGAVCGQQSTRSKSDKGAPLVQHHTITLQLDGYEERLSDRRRGVRAVGAHRLR